MNVVSHMDRRKRTIVDKITHTRDEEVQKHLLVYCSKAFDKI